MFEMLLDNDEDIKWCNGINVSAYVKKNFFKTLLLGLFPPTAVIMLGVPYTLIFLILSLFNIIPLWIGLEHLVFSILVIIIFITILNMSGKNTYFCITNKRVIKRSGSFNNKFIHYSLKNIGTVEVSGGLFDSNGKNRSANLKVSIKDFHFNTDGNGHLKFLEVISLNNAYEAYKLLNELTEGNNEVIGVKNEK